MTATAPPDTRARAFVARLLRTNDPERRRALIENHRLDPTALHDAVLALVEEAERIVGADPPRMERICRDALALAETAGDEYASAMARLRFADARRVQGHFAEAIPLYDAANETLTRLGRPVEAARTRNGWIECMARLGHLDEALRAARAARRVFLARGELMHAGSLLNTVGTVQLHLGSRAAALRSFTRAQALFRAAGPRGDLLVARMHQNRGAALSQLGRHREALAELELARPTFEAAGEAGGLARLTMNQGLNYFALGRHAAALRALEGSLRMARALGIAAREQIVIARAIADCYLALNRPNGAVRIIAEAEAALAESGQPDVAFELASRRIIALLRLGRRDDALAALATVMAGQRRMSQSQFAWLAVQRAAILLDEGQLEQALEDTHAVLASTRVAGDRRVRADAYTIQGAALLALGRLDEALHSALRAWRLAAAIDAAPLQYRAHELLGRLAEARAAESRAIQHYQRAIEQLEREQSSVIFEFRDSFATGRRASYERLATLQLRAGRAGEALNVVERGKSRALIDAIRGGFELRPRGNPETRRLARELARAREDYAVAYSRDASDAGSMPVDALRRAQRPALADHEAHIAGLVQRLQIAGADSSFADPYLRPIEAGLVEMPAETTLLEFAYSGNDLLRFVLRGGTVSGAILPDAVPQVERLIRALRLNLDATQRAAPAQLASLETQARAVLARTYGLLFSDLSLADTATLVVVPHGLLHYLPFHALHDGERFLVERVAVSYAPSAALYGVCRGRRPRGRGALVLAHSAGGRLPFTLDEAASVARVLGAGVYQEEAAASTVLRREGRRAALIHIAAHGEFRPDAPLFSRLELADGPLTTADIFELQLSAGLVTLSACETGRGVLGGGDELAGMVRAFLYAGASALLVSQWRVDDAVTAALMTHFYRALADGAGRASALRQAQAALINGVMPESRCAHPFFWAGFQLIGDDAPLTPRPRGSRRRRDDHE